MLGSEPRTAKLKPSSHRLQRSVPARLRVDPGACDRRSPRFPLLPQAIEERCQQFRIVRPHHQIGRFVAVDLFRGFLPQGFLNRKAWGVREIPFLPPTRFRK